MNVLYVYRKSKEEDTLRYSVRSVELFISPGNIIVAGDSVEMDIGNIVFERKPDPIEDVNYILKNTVKSLKGSWVLMHDDMFLLKPYKPRLYYDGKLKDAVRLIGGGRNKAIRAVLEKHPDGHNYALHYPLPFECRKMSEALSMYDKPVSYMNAYGNYAHNLYIQKKVKDCKMSSNQFMKAKLSNMSCVSTYNESPQMIEHLGKMFPKKSRYEV